MSATIPVDTRWRKAALALIALAFVASAGPAAATARSTFDHDSTGFVLEGLHRDAPCESCHVGGVFKGTPHDCWTCHTSGSRFGATAKTTRHILSSNNCAECHTPFGWSPVATFNHLNVIGTCSSCHNGVQASGKPANHVPTTAECSTCHLVTMPWAGIRFAHTGITGDCARCHDNVHAPGQPPGGGHGQRLFRSWREHSSSRNGISAGEDHRRRGFRYFGLQREE